VESTTKNDALRALSSGLVDADIPDRTALHELQESHWPSAPVSVIFFFLSTALETSSIGSTCTVSHFDALLRRRDCRATPRREVVVDPRIPFPGDIGRSHQTTAASTAGSGVS
jgi:hypothetical protein